MKTEHHFISTHLCSRTVLINNIKRMKTHYDTSWGMPWRLIFYSVLLNMSRVFRQKVYKMQIYVLWIEAVGASYHTGNEL